MDKSVAHFDYKEWDSLIRIALRHWHQPAQLSQSPLLGLRSVATRAKADGISPTVALKRVIEEAIVRFAPRPDSLPDLSNLDEPRWLSDEWRYYNILRAFTLRDWRLSPDKMQEQTGLSKTHYYREYELARRMLAEELRNMEGMPTNPDDAPWQLEYPSGGMRTDDPFYIERAADRELTLALRSGGQTITIRGSRQVGKTSMLARGIQQAQANGDAQLVYVDFQGVGDEARGSLRDLCRFLSMRIIRTLNLDLAVWEREWAEDFLPQDNLERLMEYVFGQVERPILLAMDEVDVLQLMPYSKDFFGLLRSWHNLRASNVLWRKLTLMMAISTEPYLLINRVGESPFNTGHVLYLKDFTLPQTAELNRRYGSPLSEAEVKGVHALLNGHPYLTRVALYTLVVREMRWSELAAAAAEDDGPFHQHLRWQLQRVAEDPRLARAMSEVVRNHGCADQKVGYHLMKAGLVSKAGDNYVCRCELYRRYFADRLDVRIAS
jgi:hypothetical protein